MSRLFNLTHGGKQFISTLPPKNLPESNFSFVEISYDEKSITKVKGTYSIQEHKDEIILSDLDISSYLEKLKDINIKLELEFIGPKPKNEIFANFIVSLSSYLVYFYFMKFPIELSLELLDNKFLKYFTSFSPINSLENSWIIQVAQFHRNFSLILLTNDERITEQILERTTEQILERINQEADQIAKEMKIFKKKLIKDFLFKKKIT